jgi:O-methyltransferase involved in polyketide biosynthesis
MLVLTEGVISYLTVEEVGSLADELKTLNHACYWIVEYLSPQAIKYRRRRSVGRGIQNAPFKFTPKDWIGFFGEHGWRPKEVRYLSEEAERLHRPIQLPLFLRVRIRIQTLFASAEKRAGFKRFQGYLMLEPEPAAFACGTPTQKQSS